ncbi:MAG: metal-dependent transcriptional regulator [Eggerthellaceae bacterium]
MKQPVHESAEDYLKAVLALERSTATSAADVAGRLGVSKASVSKALSKLERQKLVHVVAHDAAHRRGRAVAERVSERHAFFRALPRAAGVEAVVADEEACRLEHCLCEDSFRKLAPRLRAAESARLTRGVARYDGGPGLSPQPNERLSSRPFLPTAKPRDTPSHPLPRRARPLRDGRCPSACRRCERPFCDGPSG